MKQGIFAWTNPLPHSSRPLQARRLYLRLLRSAQRIPITAARYVWAIRIWRAALNELESLTDADFRDMPIKRGEVAFVAWETARRYVEERTVPARFVTGFVALTVAVAALVAAAIALMA